MLRAIGAVLMIAIVAGLIAAAILLATDAGQSTDLGKYIHDSVNDGVDGIQQFIQDNTASS
jgi:nitrogen fixation-related uncharacterized protein